MAEIMKSMRRENKVNTQLPGYQVKPGDPDYKQSDRHSGPGNWKPVTGNLYSGNEVDIHVPEIDHHFLKLIHNVLAQIAVV